MCAGTLVHYEQTVRTPCPAREEDAASAYGYTGTLRVHTQDTVSGQGGGRGECVRAHWNNTSKQSGHRVRPGRRTRRVPTGTLVHYEYTLRTPCQAREEDAASAYGYTGTLRANSQDTVSGQGGGRGECLRVHWYTMSKQSG